MCMNTIMCNACWLSMRSHNVFLLQEDDANVDAPVSVFSFSRVAAPLAVLYWMDIQHLKKVVMMVTTMMSFSHQGARRGPDIHALVGPPHKKRGENFPLH